MTYTYFYKTPDGTRHEAQLDAASRDAAFSLLREKGIRPIKVMAADGSKANGEVRGVRRRVVAILVILTALVSGILVFMQGHRPVSFYKADGTFGTSADGTPVSPMTRRQIYGNREKINMLMEKGISLVFASPAECHLAHYVEPGRPVSITNRPSGALIADFKTILDKPIFTFSGEMPECVELKGMVAGMKEELRMFLASGGSIHEYLARLEERQKMETSYRDKAISDLKKSISSDSPETAYQHWKDVNKWLLAMGISQIPLPDVLIPYLKSLQNDDASPSDL